MPTTQELDKIIDYLRMHESIGNIRSLEGVVLGRMTFECSHKFHVSLERVPEHVWHKVMLPELRRLDFYLQVTTFRNDEPKFLDLHLTVRRYPPLTTGTCTTGHYVITSNGSGTSSNKITGLTTHSTSDKIIITGGSST